MAGHFGKSKKAFGKRGILSGRVKGHLPQFIKDRNEEVRRMRE